MPNGIFEGTQVRQKYTLLWSNFLIFRVGEKEKEEGKKKRRIGVHQLCPVQCINASLTV